MGVSRRITKLLRPKKLFEVALCSPDIIPERVHGLGKTLNLCETYIDWPLY